MATSRSIQNPCAGAFQVGSTTDLSAIWQRDGNLFMVIYDARQVDHVLEVTADEIHRALDPPVPSAPTALPPPWPEQRATAFAAFDQAQEIQQCLVQIAAGEVGDVQRPGRLRHTALRRKWAHIRSLARTHADGRSRSEEST